MTVFLPTSMRAARTILIPVAALAVLASVDVSTAAARGDDGSAASQRRTMHRGARHAGSRGYRAASRRHRHVGFAGFRRSMPFAAAGIPAGYSSDDSPFNVDADDNAFDTGAFYGCLHTVMTAGGYRPAATCD